MKYLHTMIRIKDVNESLRFFCDGLGLKEIKRIENEKGRFTLLFLSALNDENAQIPEELLDANERKSNRKVCL